MIPVQNASPLKMQAIQVLKLDYWQAMLPHVVDDSLVDSYIADIRNGVSIGRPPASSVTESPNWPSTIELHEEVSKVIKGDLESGRLYGPFAEPPFPCYIVSPLGAFRKRDGLKIRLIHDLSFPRVGSVNCLIDPDEFSLSYSSIDSAVAACRAYDAPILSSVDLKDAYKAIGIAVEDWHLMGFKWAMAGADPQYYFSKVLSFGLRSAPALFDRFAGALELFFKHSGVDSHVVRYVDDFLLVSSNMEVAASHLSKVIEVSRAAGFTIQDSKVTPPCRCLEFLGIVVDLEGGVLRISSERMAEIQGILAHWQGQKVISKRRLLKIVGKLAFAAKVVRTGRAFLGRLIGLAKSATALNHRVRLSQAARRDLTWWQECLHSHNGTRLLEVDWSSGTVYHVYTDASDFGYGACCGEEWFAISYTGQSAAPRARSINWRELHAAAKALATWGPSLRSERIIFHIDNTTTCCLLNKLYSPVPELMELVRTWCILVEKFSVHISVVYISTKDNVLADALSRGDFDLYFNTYGGKGRRVWPEPIQYFDENV